MRHTMIAAVLAAVLALTARPGAADLDLRSTSQAGSVHLSIYKAERLALVQEERELALAAGANRVSFGWGDTKIDPSSISLRLDGPAQVTRTSFPPDAPNTAVWDIEAERAGPCRLHVAYLAEGFSFDICYQAVLDEGADTVSLRALAQITNDTKRDFEDLGISLVFGDVRLVDEIGKLAGRKVAEGSAPEPEKPEPGKPEGIPPTPPNPWVTPSLGGLPPAPLHPKGPVARPKTGAAGPYICPLAGQIDMAQGETKLLTYLQAGQVPVQRLYRYDPDQYGGEPHLFWAFANTQEGGLGALPLTGGKVDVYAAGVGQEPNLIRLGEGNMPDKKVGEKVELDLGGDPNLVVERTLGDYQTANLHIDAWGRIDGLDTREQYQTIVRNRTGRQVALEVIHSLEGVWEVQTDVEYRQDNNKVVCALNLAPDEARTLSYTVITHHGTRTRGK